MEKYFCRSPLRYERHELCRAGCQQRHGLAVNACSPFGGKRLYTNGVFNTNWIVHSMARPRRGLDRSGQQEPRLSVGGGLCRAARGADGSYPFWLNTGRVIEHFHSRTKTKRVAQLHEMVPENYVEINSSDAASLKVVTGNLIRVTSRRGEIVVKAKVTDTTAPGAVFIPMHFGDLDPTDVRRTAGGRWP